MAADKIDRAGQTKLPADQQIAEDARLLSSQLSAMRQRLFPPSAFKTLRSFTSGEAAKLIGVSDGYLRQLSISGEGPQPEINAAGRRSYTLADINALRRFLAGQHEPGSPKARQYLKWRDEAAGEHLQVIAVTNFKGGSGKTTTATHLQPASGAEGLPNARHRSRSAGLLLRAARLPARARSQRQRDALRRHPLRRDAAADERHHQAHLFRRARSRARQSGASGVRARRRRAIWRGRRMPSGMPFFTRVQEALGSVAIATTWSCWTARRSSAS